MEPNRSLVDPATTPVDAQGNPGAPQPTGGWPNIADYWPDAPQRMGPPADVHEDPAAAATRTGPSLHQQALTEPTWSELLPHENVRPERSPHPVRPSGVRPGRRRLRPMLGVAAAVLLVLGGGFVAYRKMADRNTAAGTSDPAISSAAPSTPSAQSTSPVPVEPAAPPAPAPSGSTGPAVVLPPQSAGRPSVTATRPAAATFSLTNDVTEITVSTARLDGGIVRVAVPDGSDAIPRTTMDGDTVRLAVSPRRKGGSTAVQVQLDSRVAWAIRLDGGTKRATLDLSDAAVRGLVFAGGAARIDLTLPRLGRTLPILMTGGVHQWRIATVGEVAVAVLARRGGGQLVLYGDDHGGLGRGERVTTTGRDGIDVDATGGFGTLTVAAA